jgi:hypothetical protein
MENWDTWEAEKPIWFDDVWLSYVDDDMMPAEALKRLRQKGGGTRRRSSLGDAIGGSVREGRGGATVLPAPAEEEDVEAGASVSVGQNGGLKNVDDEEVGIAR